LKFLRGVGGAIVGLAIAFCGVMAAEAISHQFYPPPPGMDPFHPDMAQLKAFIATLPAPAFLLVLSGHLLGTLAGTFAAAKLGGSAIPAYVVGTILLAAGIGNAFMIPQPAWFSAVSIVGYVVMTLVGARLGRGGAS